MAAIVLYTYFFKDQWKTVIFWMRSSYQALFAKPFLFIVGRGRYAMVQNKPSFLLTAEKVGLLAVSKNQILSWLCNPKLDLVLNGPLCCTIAKHPLPIMYQSIICT